MEKTAKTANTRMYWRFLGITFFVFLLIFAISEALGLHLLEDADVMQEWTLPVAALVGVGLLMADVFLPVPSSMIMVAHGTLFGFVGGALLSVMGGVGAALVGYWIGKKGKSMLRRWFDPQAFEVGDRFFARWGIASVILSRPVPLIAETVSVAAGASNLEWKKMTLGSLLGILPISLAYSWVGAYLGSGNAGIWAFLGVVGVAGIFVTAGYLVQRGKQRTPVE